MCEPRPGDEAEGAHLEAAAEALVRLAQAVDLRDHRRARLGVEAADRVLVDRGEVVRGRGRRARRAWTEAIWVTWLWTLTPSAVRKPRAIEPAATRAAVSRALARSSTLRMSSWPYFWAPTRSAWPGRGRWTSSSSSLDRPGVHPLLPVGVVAVGDEDGDRAAERAAVADAGADLDRVGLDLHPPAAAVAELAPRHVAVERLAVELEPGRHALDDRDEPGPVRLAGGREAEAVISVLRL